MIDIHTHILPGVDDGADSIEESVAMAMLAADSGTRGIVASSHGNQGGLTVEAYEEAFDLLKDRLKREGIPLTLYPGMEILMDHEVEERLVQGELLTINNTDYVLIEFDFEEELWMVEDYLQMLEEAGYLPIIAHPERYAFVQRHPEEVYNWARRGFVIQVNKGSLLGAYGKKEQDTALSLLSHQLIHVIASDAHSSLQRTPKMGNITRFLTGAVHPKYQELLLRENPEHIIRGEEVVAFPPLPYRRNRNW